MPLLLGLKRLPAAAQSLLGWQVLLCGSNEAVGTVVQVQQLTSYPLLRVTKESTLEPYGFKGRESHSIPLVPAIANDLYPRQRVLLITPPPGLLDLGRRELLLSFLSKELLQCMPTRQQLLSAGRQDLVGVINKVGGFTEAALLLGLRATRRPAGYWDSLEVMDAELDAFVAGCWTALPLDADEPEQGGQGVGPAGDDDNPVQQRQPAYYYYNMATRSILWELPAAARPLMPAASSTAQQDPAAAAAAAGQSRDGATQRASKSQEYQVTMTVTTITKMDVKMTMESFEMERQVSTRSGSRAVRRSLLALAGERVMPSQSCIKSGTWDPDMMPSVRQLQRAGRQDLVKSVMIHGGCHAVAQRLGLQCNRPAPGTAAGSSVEGLAQQLLQFMRQLLAAGRPDLVAGLQKYGHDRIRLLLGLPAPARKQLRKGYGVIGSTADGPEEIEHAPAVSITLASLPGVAVGIKHVTAQDLPDGEPHPSSFILLADPEFSKVTELTAGLDFAFPAANKIGGLVSAGKLSPARAMFAWSQQQQQQQQQHEKPVAAEQQQQQQRRRRGGMVRTGAVVLSLQGPVEMELLVAQGCRPLGESVYSIDKVAGHSSVVLGLRDAAGRQLTPVEALQLELQQAATSRQELLQLLSNMALGLMPEMLRAADGPPPEAQDFLIRGMAVDKAGFMVVGDAVRVGQRLRFMVRDRKGAQQDLLSHCLAYKRRQLAAAMSVPDSRSSSSSSSSRGQAFGMLLFSCNGRGMNLYDEPSYDSRTLASYIPVPCGGFMCNGELGSIGGATHLHGFTCATAVFRAANSSSSSSSSSSSGSGSDNAGDSRTAVDGSSDGLAVGVLGTAQACLSAALLAVLGSRFAVQVADAMEAAGPQRLFRCTAAEPVFLAAPQLEQAAAAAAAAAAMVAAAAAVPAAAVSRVLAAAAPLNVVCNHLGCENLAGPGVTPTVWHSGPRACARPWVELPA
ncbi:hypothetical protein COO60DRAFT_1637771 [Scenedesmus sp. NREL 46B-D3]|nr:hypothetical protein COO60DRAFT_1637771 [Scenedesmus sp. NREL 46B-D3]